MCAKDQPWRNPAKRKVYARTVICTNTTGPVDVYPPPGMVWIDLRILAPLTMSIQLGDAASGGQRVPQMPPYEQADAEGAILKEIRSPAYMDTTLPTGYVMEVLNVQDVPISGARCQVPAGASSESEGYVYFSGVCIPSNCFQGC